MRLAPVFAVALLAACAATPAPLPQPPTAANPPMAPFGFNPPRGMAITADCPGGEVAMRARFAGIQSIVCSDQPNDVAAGYAREALVGNALSAGWVLSEPQFGFSAPALTRFNPQRGCKEHLLFDRGQREGAGPAMTLNLLLVDDFTCRTSK